MCSDIGLFILAGESIKVNSQVNIYTAASETIVATVSAVTTEVYGRNGVLHCVLVSNEGVILVKSGGKKYVCEYLLTLRYTRIGLFLN